MGTFDRFEDIDAWKEARVLAGKVYQASKSGPGSRDFGFRDQIRRAAVSVMANIAEGFGRRTNKDFANFLYNAKASALEVMSHLYVALDQEYIDQKLFDELHDSSNKIRKMLVGLIRYLENNPK